MQNTTNSPPLFSSREQQNLSPLEHADTNSHRADPLYDLDTWANAAYGSEGDDRRLAATRIRTAYDTEATTLDLSNLEITQLPLCLGKLNKLERLDLFATLITGVPESLGELTELRYLELGCTSIEALPQSIVKLSKLDYLSFHTSRVSVIPEAISALSNLETLNACCCPIAHLPETMSQLVNLRIVYLGSTHIESFPESIGRLPRLEQLDLSDTPALTELITTVMDYQRRAGVAELPALQRALRWSTLEHEEDCTLFGVLLKRLSEHVLAERVTPAHVVDVIDEAAASKETRQCLFEATFEADRDCHDRVLLIFNTMQALARASQLQRDAAPHEEMVKLAQGMLKQALLDEMVPKVMHKQWTENRRAGNDVIDPETGHIANNGRGTGPNLQEALEVQLALRERLAEALHLPFPVTGLYTTAPITSLSEQDINDVANAVKEAMANKANVIRGLVEQPVWRHYLATRYVDELNERLQNVQSQIAHLFEGGIPAETIHTDTGIEHNPAYLNYATQMGELNQQLAHAKTQFLQQKTAELFVV